MRELGKTSVSNFSTFLFAGILEGNSIYEITIHDSLVWCRIGDKTVQLYILIICGCLRNF